MKSWKRQIAGFRDAEKDIPRLNRFLAMLGILAAALMLGACDTRTLPSTPTVQVVPPEVTPTEEPASSQVPLEQRTEANTETPEATSTAPMATASPTARGPGQEGTDPTTVDLASGKPTLVEFFSFW